jgi:trk system potassium uptake protein TrkH
MLLVPLIVLLYYHDEWRFWYAFLVPSLISIGLGVSIYCLVRKYTKGDRVVLWRNNILKGNLTVLAVWLYSFVSGALPFVISGQLNFLQALFESVSGWGTVGITIMDVRQVPKVFLFHRSFMQFCGGMGFVMVMLMFVQGKQAMKLYSAEGHSDILIPNLRKTVRAIFVLYCCFTLVATLLYWMLGMTLFDAINHAMCVLSTAGFSTQYNSIGEYNNVGIEIVSVVFMLIGATNFGALLILLKGNIKRFVRISEIRFMLILLVIAISVVAISLCMHGLSISQAIGHSAFISISTFSTTGFVNQALDEPQVVVGVIGILMIVGGGAGSTAGGVKLTRIYVLCRVAWSNISRRVSSTRKIESLHYIKVQGKAPIDESLVSDTIGFFLIYLAMLAIGSLLVAAFSGASLGNSIFEFASVLGTTGLSIGIATPDANAGTLITLMIGMVMGRLEIFIVLIGIYAAIVIPKDIFAQKIINRQAS